MSKIMKLLLVALMTIFAFASVEAGWSKKKGHFTRRGRTKRPTSAPTNKYGKVYSKKPTPKPTPAPTGPTHAPVEILCNPEGCGLYDDTYYYASDEPKGIYATFDNPLPKRINVGPVLQVSMNVMLHRRPTDTYATFFRIGGGEALAGDALTERVVYLGVKSQRLILSVSNVNHNRRMTYFPNVWLVCNVMYNIEVQICDGDITLYVNGRQKFTVTRTKTLQMSNAIINVGDTYYEAAQMTVTNIIVQPCITNLRPNYKHCPVTPPPCYTEACIDIPFWEPNANPNCKSTYNGRHCSDPWGCDECQNGFFKEQTYIPCVECAAIEGCLECGDYEGCKVCDVEGGYQAKWDPDCDMKLCEREVNAEPNKYDECDRYGGIVSYCSSYRCLGNKPNGEPENPNCMDVQPWGCRQCAPGYYREDPDLPCLKCTDNCKKCIDWVGCTVCNPGHARVFDHHCDFGWCHAV